MRFDSFVSPKGDKSWGMNQDTGQDSGLLGCFGCQDYISSRQKYLADTRIQG